MNNAHELISDTYFIELFENLTLDSDYFDHIGHVRLAWLYLHQYEFDDAMVKIADGIEEYAISLGATNKYHVTITNAIVKIIKQRMNGEDNWQSFINLNSDLVDDCIKVLLNYYSEEVLFSEKARTSLVEADVREI
ncbi:MAG: hypothetical protein OEY19_10610 [Gammaproteobacteria bacterium]|nr:hypothetical protein [Gammaproteobacteria bacterium]MDH5629645.1 hypothetical protein [Gammaproteobacteria bacterium]